MKIKIKTFIFFILLLSNQMTWASNMILPVAEGFLHPMSIIFLANKIGFTRKRLINCALITGGAISLSSHFIKHPLTDISSIGLSSITLFASLPTLKNWNSYDKEQILFRTGVFLLSGFSIYSRVSSLINHKNKKSKQNKKSEQNED